MLTQHLGAKRLLTLNTGGAAIMLMLVPVAAVRGGARGSLKHQAFCILPRVRPGGTLNLVWLAVAISCMRCSNG